MKTHTTIHSIKTKTTATITNEGVKSRKENVIKKAAGVFYLDYNTKNSLLPVITKNILQINVSECSANINL